MQGSPLYPKEMSILLSTPLQSNSLHPFPKLGFVNRSPKAQIKKRNSCHTQDQCPIHTTLPFLTQISSPHAHHPLPNSHTSPFPTIKSPSHHQQFLLMYIKRSLRKGSFPFLFEPNDQITRDNLKAAVDGFLGDILIKRGLYDFVTLCDASNNTPDRIDNNQLWCDVALKPVKAAEFIYIPVRVLSTGAKMP